MTQSPDSHPTDRAAELSAPALAALAAENGPWWVWSLDGRRLIATNAAGARSMGASGPSLAVERVYGAGHAFATQVERLAPNLPADGTPRMERLRLFGRLGSEAVVAQARRIVVAGKPAVAVTLAGPAKGVSAASAAEWIAGIAGAPALLFGRDGDQIGANAAARPLSGLSLGQVLGAEASAVGERLRNDGRASIDLVTGPMLLTAIPSIGAILAVMAPSAAPAIEPPGVRLVETPAPVMPPAAEFETIAAAAPQSGVTDERVEDAEAERVEDETVETGSQEADTPQAEAPEVEPAEAATPEAAAPADNDEIAPAMRVVETPATAALMASSATPVAAPIPAAPAQESPATPAPAAFARLSWKLDASGRFTEVKPPEAGLLVGLTLAEAAARYGLPADGAFAAALSRGEPFAGAAFDWPLAEGAWRTPVALSGYPGRAGGFSGLGVVTGPATPRPADGPEAEAAPFDTVEPDANDTGDTETPVDDQPAEAVAEAVVAEPPVADTAASEDAIDSDEAVAGSAADESPEMAAPTDVETQDIEAPEVVAAPPVAVPPAEPVAATPTAPTPTRPTLDLILSPPNVVPLRPSGPPADPKRAGLSVGERNAFREIARALGAKDVSETATEPPAPPAMDVAQAKNDAPAKADAPPAAQAPSPAIEPPPPAVAETPATMPTPVAPPKLPVGSPPARDFIAAGTPGGPAPSAFASLSPPAPPAPFAAATLPPAPAILRQAEEALALVDRAPVGLAVHRGNAILYANRTLLDWIGLPDRDALEAAGGVSRLFAQAPAEEATGRMTVAHADGAAIPVEARLSRLSWDGENALLFTLTRLDEEAGADRAARDDALLGLRQRLDEVETILDTATDGVVIVDASGVIQSLNHSAEALFGYGAAEVAGKSFATLFAPESHRSAMDYCDSLVTSGVASVLNDGRQIIGRVKQGGLIPLYMTMGRLGAGDKPKLAAVLRDITQWKQAEEDLVAARRHAETASLAKSDFLAKVSHELRTPLNAIIGFSEVMIEERFGPVGNDRYRDYLRDIHASGGHVLSLINDLLDLSKIEAGKLDLSFTSVDLNDIVQSTVAIMQPQANRERIIIRSSLMGRLPNVVADARSMRQIVLNLLSNSIKFTPAAGQVIVSTRLSDAGEAVLSVRDTGVGMTAQEVKMALEPFRQLATTSPHAGKGTGLGLPLTKALVEANKATFGIASTPQNGTTVEVVFPPHLVLAE